MSKTQPNLSALRGQANHEPTLGPIVFTVSELTRGIRNLLEENLGSVWVTGETTNVRRPASGHYYFTLKDEYAQINTVMWRTLADSLQFEVKDGLAVLVSGELTVYEPRGQYQIIARRVEPRGIGALQLAFTQMKEKLAREGLFDPARKQLLPLIPARIAIITSPTGAAIHDMLKVITSRFPTANVIVCPVRVQGDEAAGEIAAMIERANRLSNVEVIILGRGGGSIEDLWAFNEEIVARTIAASRIPVISAVGHETDFTIADFAADIRALTPTDAGVRVVPQARKLADNLKVMAGRLGQCLLGRTAAARERLDGIARSYGLRHPMEPIRAREQRLDDLTQRLMRAATSDLRMQRQRFEAAASRLASLSPLAVLRRGYSLTLRDADEAVLRDAAILKPGDIVRTRLHKGEFRAAVLAEPPPKKPPQPLKPKAMKRPRAKPKKSAATAARRAKKKVSSTSKRRTSDGPKESKV